MMKYIKSVSLLVMWAVSSNIGRCQGDSSTHLQDTTFTLVGDTLFSNRGFSIYVGQKLLSGKGSGENGWFRAVGFKTSVAWPVLLWQDAETRNNTTYQSDRQVRENDKVREYLPPGTVLVVKRIKKSGNRKTGHWFTVSLRTDSFPRIKFQANIGPALSLKELMLESMDK